MDAHSLSSIFQEASTATKYLRSRLPEELRRPEVAIICGSGLGEISETVAAEPRFEIDYYNVPYFPESTAKGHAGKLVFGLLGKGKKPSVLMVGRAHFYEGYSIELVTFPIRVFKLLDVHTLLGKYLTSQNPIVTEIEQAWQINANVFKVTNAAGGISSEYLVGDIVIINDHLNLAGMVGANPLRGPNANEFGERFPALSDLYDLELRRLAHGCWRDLGLNQSRRQLQEGTYAFVGGPTYETRAECRMLRLLGADLVGMSTVPEVIVAKHCGIRVLAMSLVTNNAVLEPVTRGDDETLTEVGGEGMRKMLSMGKATHEEVLKVGQTATSYMQGLVRQIVERLPPQMKISDESNSSL